MSQSACARRFLLTLIILGAAAPFLLWGTWRSAQSMYNDPTGWVPESFDERMEYQWFTDHFELDDAVILSWPGCSVDDQRLAALEDELEAPADPELRAASRELFERVVTGYSAVRELTAEPSNLPRGAALARLQGTLVGPDWQSSCAIVVLTAQGARQRGRSIDTILAAGERAVGVDRSQFSLVGPPVDGHVIDTESIRSLCYFAVPSGLVAWLLCCVCLRCWRFTLLVVLVAAVGECFVMSLVCISGQPMNAVLIVMPPLMFVLTVSAGVHLINYYYDEVRLRGAAGSVRRAMAKGWLPCLLAAATTAGGLASLMISDLVPIRTFGAISATGILVTVWLLLFLLPGAMELWPREPSRRRRFPGSGRGTAAAPDGSVLFAGLSTLACRHSRGIAVAFLSLALVSAWGLSRLETSVNIRSLFCSESRIMNDYRQMESSIGPLVPLEVVVHFDRGCSLDPLERLEIVNQLARDIAAVDSIGGVTSAASFLPPVPQRTWQRAVYRRRMQASFDSLYQNNYLAEEAQRQSWRISARVPTLEDIDYGHFLSGVQLRVERLLAEHRRTGVEGVSATCTGLMPLVDEAQRALLGDLFASFLLALAVVTLVMIAYLRSVAAGLLAMLPNAFPSIILFGTMGWLGRPVDIGLVMTASVALGIAVDGTLHFLTWYQRETAGGASAAEAVSRCFEHCGRAMIQTTIICGLGMLVFAFSRFVPTRSFAWMMFTLLLAALAGDFVLLPALLIGPLGKVFARRRVFTPAPATTRPDTTRPAARADVCSIRPPHEALLEKS